MRRRERGAKKGRRGGGETKGGKRGMTREGHEETSQGVACSVNVRLVVPLLRLLHGAAII